MRYAAAILSIFMALAAVPTPAHADAIDGDWCSAEGLKLSIAGPSIRLPSGREIEGQYRRHEFAYQARPATTAQATSPISSNRAKS